MTAGATLDAIDQAIREADAARKKVGAHRGKQITQSDFLDYLKSVCYSWFRSHRRVLEAHLPLSEFEAVDEPFQRVLNATMKASVRAAYLDALKAVRVGLIGLRSVAVTLPASTAKADLAPDFAQLGADVSMRAILTRRWEECQRCLRAEANLAATVMMGGFLEALFIAKANQMTDKRLLFQAKAAPIDRRTQKPLQLSEWTLQPYIAVGQELGWISRTGKDVAAVLRDYLNYVHPEKERSHGVTLNSQDASMFWELTKSLTRQLLAP
jgi:hypothetical protein